MKKNRIFEYAWIAIAISSTIGGMIKAKLQGNIQNMPLLLFVIAFIGAFMYSMRKARRKFFERDKE